MLQVRCPKQHHWHLFLPLLGCNYVALIHAQHSRPYRPLVHDLVGLQRNVSCALVYAACGVTVGKVVALEEPRLGSKDWSVVQAWVFSPQPKPASCA